MLSTIDLYSDFINLTVEKVDSPTQLLQIYSKNVELNERIRFLLSKAFELENNFTLW